MATERRLFYIWDSTDSETLQITEKEDLKYVRKVLRLSNGDALTLINPNNQHVLKATIQDAEKTCLTVTPNWESLQIPSQTLPQITMGVGLIKEKRWEWMLQKATELGASSIIPIISEYSDYSWDEAVKEVEKRQERWGDIVKAAALQSEGTFIPTIQSPQLLTDFLSETANFDYKLAPLARYEEGVNSLDKFSVNTTVAGLVGPEGGWSDTEKDSIIKHKFTTISLSPRILRTETAVVSLLTLINSNSNSLATQ